MDVRGQLAGQGKAGHLTAQQRSIGWRPDISASRQCSALAKNARQTMSWARTMTSKHPMFLTALLCMLCVSAAQAQRLAGETCATPADGPRYFDERYACAAGLQCNEGLCESPRSLPPTYKAGFVAKGLAADDAVTLFFTQERSYCYVDCKGLHDAAVSARHIQTRLSTYEKRRNTQAASEAQDGFLSFLSRNREPLNAGTLKASENIPRDEQEKSALLGELSTANDNAERICTGCRFCAMY